MHRLIDPLAFALERLWQHRNLVFWTLVGLASATTLALSLTLYVDAVNTNLLTDNLDDPPYAFRFRYLGSWEGRITPKDMLTADGVINDTFVQNIGMPVQTATRYVSGGSWAVSLDGDTPLRIGTYPLGSLAGGEGLMRVTSGTWPSPVDANNGLAFDNTAEPPDSNENAQEGNESVSETIPVLLHENMLYNNGIQLGDTLQVTIGANVVNLEVAALWQPVNEDDPQWILPPSFFEQVFIIQEEALFTALEGVELSIEEVDWQLVFDGTDLRTSGVGGLLSGITDGFRIVSSTLPGIRMDISPEEGLKAFNTKVNQLTQQLVIVILPVAGLIMYFVTMLAGLLVGNQQQEDITLNSRGMSRRALLGIHALMWIMLAAAALSIGLLISPSLVQLIGRTTSFMSFDSDIMLEVVFTQQSLMVGGITGLLAASTGLYMAWRTTGQSIMSFKREKSRGGVPLWQRLYADIILLVISFYLLYTMGSSGGLTANATDPFSDPLVFLAPTIFSLGCTLFFLRIYPMLLGFSGRFMALTRNIPLLMALREITRSIARYRSTLLMMCFTLALIGYTASMASTLDRSLEDVIDYQVGADSVMITATDAQTEESSAADGSTTIEVTGYNTLPASGLLDIEGVEYVSRVGEYTVQMVLPTQRIDGALIGLDRGAMPAIARFREDFAPMSLADTLNLLANNRTGLLINSQTLEAQSLAIGQELTLQVNALGSWYEIKVPVVGVIDYFPTIDPREGFFGIMNIDPLMELVGTELPHNVWMDLADDADPVQVEAEALAQGYPVIKWLDPVAELQAALADPTRRGVLGFLSIGFVAAIVLALVGSVIQSTASFKEQAVQIGSLRAMGLGSTSVSTYLISSQGISALGSIVGGTMIGVGTTLLFLPLMDFSGGLPPYLIQVAWLEIAGVYALFAGALLVVMVSTTIVLGREQVSTLVKMGDI